MLDQDLFVHHVFFWLANPESKEEQAQLLKGIQSLSTVESVKGIHIGVPASTDRPVIDTTYHFSLLLVFESLTKQEEYQIDPIHLKFVDENKHLWSKVLIYDSVGAF